MKSEMEVAMKLLEKDIHEKQDTIISLRRQLDDIKQINLEMYKKLQVKIRVLLSFSLLPVDYGFNIQQQYFGNHSSRYSIVHDYYMRLL